MEYFAGLDVSMEETHVCVVTRDGAVMHQVRVPSTPADIAAALARGPACRRVLFETGRMAPMRCPNVAIQHYAVIISAVVFVVVLVLFVRQLPPGRLRPARARRTPRPLA